MATNPASTSIAQMSPEDALQEMFVRLAEPHAIIEKIHSMVPRKSRLGTPNLEIRLTINGRLSLTEPSIYRGYGNLWFVWTGIKWMRMNGPMTATLSELVAMWEFGAPKGGR